MKGFFAIWKLLWVDQRAFGCLKGGATYPQILHVLSEIHEVKKVLTKEDAQ